MKLYYEVKPLEVWSLDLGFRLIYGGTVSETGSIITWFPPPPSPSDCEWIVPGTEDEH